MGFAKSSQSQYVKLHEPLILLLMGRYLLGIVQCHASGIWSQRRQSPRNNITRRRNDGIFKVSFQRNLHTTQCNRIGNLTYPAVASLCMG